MSFCFLLQRVSFFSRKVIDITPIGNPLGLNSSSSGLNSGDENFRIGGRVSDAVSSWHPTMPAPTCCSGDALAKGGQPAEGLGHLQRAAQLDPLLVSAHIQLF